MRGKTVNIHDAKTRLSRLIARVGRGVRFVIARAIVPANSELRALYVSAEHGRKGVGRAILLELEALARKAGVTELRMDSSVNAARFYEANGYLAIERAEHTLRSGVRMECVRMRKTIHL
jgi:GNAT superfamily N-acetyltransferase